MPSTLNDAIRDSLGGGVITDVLLDFYRDGGAGANSPLPDAERQWLIIQLTFPPIVLDTNNDMWMKFLPPPGAINDRQFLYWLANPTLPTAALFPIGESASTVSPANATIQITVGTDGFVRKSVNGGASVILYDWLIQGVAADFEFMASGVTGDSGNLTGSALNTFLPAPVSWTLTNADDAAGTKAVNFTLQVRRVSDAGGGNQVPVSLQATVTAAPIIPLADLQPVSQTASAQTPLDASVNVEVDSDGFVKVSTNGGAQSNLYTWLLVGVNADFQFRASGLTGDTANFSGAALNTWLAAPVDWSLINTGDSPANKAVDFTLEVRRVSDFIVLDSTTVHLGANVTTLPPNADLQTVNQTSSAQSPANASTLVTIATSGFVTASLNGGAATNLYSYVTNGVASDFQFMGSSPSGDTGAITGSAFGVWLAPPVAWTVTNSNDTAGTLSANWTVQVRRASDSVVLDSATFTLSATVTPPPPNADLQNVTQSATAVSPANSSVLLMYDTDGFAKRTLNGGASSNLFNYVLTGVANDFQFRASGMTGNTGDVTGSALNTWLAPPVSWTLLNSVDAAGTKSVNFTVEVRRTSDSVVLDTSTVNLSAAVTAPPPNADLQNVNESATNNLPLECSVSITAAGGFVTVQKNSSGGTDLYSYIVTGTSSDFEFQAINVTGDTAYANGLFNSWGANNWSIDNFDATATTRSITFTLQVRRVSDQVLLDSCTVVLTATTQLVYSADLQPVTQTANATSPNNASVTLACSNTGYVTSSLNGGTANNLYQWYQSAAIGDYQFRASNLAGDTGAVTGTFNVWQAAPISWTLTNSNDTPSTLSANWLVEVRKTSDGTILDSATFTATGTVAPNPNTPAGLLFAAGELGYWFDASDIATLWQDSAGATPVTALEQPVGKWADKSGRNVVATQATAASRPIWSARKNQITISENFADAYWTKTLCTVSGTGVLVEATGTGNHSFSRTTVIPAIPGPASPGYTISAYFRVKPGTRANAGFLIGNTGLTKYYRVVLDLTYTNGLGTAYTKVVGTAENVGGMLNPQVMVTDAGLGDGTRDIFLSATFPGAEAAGIGTAIYAASAAGALSYAGTNGSQALTVLRAQYEYGYPTSYQQSTAAATYDAGNGFYYLKFDGTDDFMTTDVVNLSAFDEVSSFVGVTKLSDNSQGVVFEFSNSTVTNSGVFGWVCPLTSGPNMVWRSRGTVTADANVSAGITSPISFVATGQSKISTDVGTCRAAGYTASVATDQGTGNWGNYASYIARRGGTSNPYTGGISQLVCRAKATTAGDVTTTEKFIAEKMGIYPQAFMPVPQQVFYALRSGTTSSATVRFKTDSFCEVVLTNPDYPSTTAPGNIFQWMKAGNPNEFQFMASNLVIFSGSGTVTGSALDTWLSPPVAWTISDNTVGTDEEVTFDVSVRRVSDGAVLGTTNFDILASRS